MGPNNRCELCSMTHRVHLVSLPGAGFPHPPLALIPGDLGGSGWHKLASQGSSLGKGGS